jgi:hypothetical protein
MNIRPVGAELFRADGKTVGRIDRQGRYDEANKGVSNQQDATVSFY